MALVQGGGYPLVVERPLDVMKGNVIQGEDLRRGAQVVLRAGGVSGEFKDNTRRRSQRAPTHEGVSTAA